MSYVFFVFFFQILPTRRALFKKNICLVVPALEVSCSDGDVSQPSVNCEYVLVLRSILG